MSELASSDDGLEQTAPVWATFGDLMSSLLGALVLVLVGMLLVQMDLASNLQEEVRLRQQEEQRRMALEKALAIPLASGRITVIEGRIGISGSVLFGFGSDELRPDGRLLLRSLVEPLKVYLRERDEMLMVSGFTDDRAVQQRSQRYSDNLELSAQRALTVTRALIDAGLPAAQVFAAAFGAQQPVAPNDDDQGRARNRRVEMAPVARPRPLLTSASSTEPPAAAATTQAAAIAPDPKKPRQSRAAARKCNAPC